MKPTLKTLDVIANLLIIPLGIWMLVETFYLDDQLSEIRSSCHAGENIKIDELEFKCEPIKGDL